MSSVGRSGASQSRNSSPSRGSNPSREAGSAQKTSAPKSNQGASRVAAQGQMDRIAPETLSRLNEMKSRGPLAGSPTQGMTGGIAAETQSKVKQMQTGEIDYTVTSRMMGGLAAETQAKIAEMEARTSSGQYRGNDMSEDLKQRVDALLGS